MRNEEREMRNDGGFLRGKKPCNCFRKATSIELKV